MPELPKDTLEKEIHETSKRLFEEIEERKAHFQRLEQSNRKRFVKSDFKVLMNI